MNTTRARCIPHLLLAGVCAGLLGFGFWLEYALGLEPCPLCISQRFFFFLAGVLALAAALLRPAGMSRLASGGLIGLSGAAGGALALRQLWLQNLPPEARPEICGPNFSQMLELFPVSEILAAMLRGDGQCAEVSWVFLGLSIPAWALLGFLCIAGFGLWEIRGGWAARHP